MSDFLVRITADAKRWHLQWHQDGVAVGDPVEISNEVANQLGSVARRIAKAFEHRRDDGSHRLPSMPSEQLYYIGAQLRDLCCWPITKQLNADGTHRLTVVSNEPRALNLPWELLPVGGEWLGCSPRWGIFRTPDHVPDLVQEKRGPPLRIVFLAAEPQGEVVLDYEKEEDAIFRATVELIKDAQVFTVDSGTYKDLDALLQDVEPHIVHLSGHGLVGGDGVGRFCFEDEAGQVDIRDAKDLAQLFAKHRVPCVFLNGCQTAQADVAGICQTLTRAGQLLALGWGARVADDRATAFTETFYRNLLDGKPISVAAATARQRILQDGLRPSISGRGEQQELTFLLPQLYAALPVEMLFDPQAPVESFRGVATSYGLVSDEMAGLSENFVGRRREQQQLIPALRAGNETFVLLHGMGGQGKSTLASRIVGRLRDAGFDVQLVKTVRTNGETAADCATYARAAIVNRISRAAIDLGDKQLAIDLANKEIPPDRRLLMAADALEKLKCVLVLDNFEDVLEHREDGAWHIADEALEKFYVRVQSKLPEGRVVVTSRYVPAGTHAHTRGLADFKEFEFFKLLRRDKEVDKRIIGGELPISLLRELYRFAGGTPRFLERLRSLLQTLPAGKLEQALRAGVDTLVQERDQFLQKHLGPDLWAKLKPAAKCLLSRLSLSEDFLTEHALAGLTGQDETTLKAAIRQGMEFGLLQVFEGRLYLPPGIWRGWLAEQLAERDRIAAHLELAKFWQEVFEKNHVQELRVTAIDALRACILHAEKAGSRELRLWASDQLATRLDRISEWRAARQILERISEDDRDATTWYDLASIDMKEGNLVAAREKFGKALTMYQQSEDLDGEAATWLSFAFIDMMEKNYPTARKKLGKSLAINHQRKDRRGEATAWLNVAAIDMNEGKYRAARKKFGKALGMKKVLSDILGQAAIWHNLASIDLKEKNYAAAKEQFGKALTVIQQFGNRAMEAAAFSQLGCVAERECLRAPATKLYGLSFVIDQAIGHWDTQKDWESFQRLCTQMGLSEPQMHTLLEEIEQSYQQDRGRALLKEAFPDWP